MIDEPIDARYSVGLSSASAPEGARRLRRHEGVAARFEDLPAFCRIGAALGPIVLACSHGFERVRLADAADLSGTWRPWIAAPLQRGWSGAAGLDRPCRVNCAARHRRGDAARSNMIWRGSGRWSGSRSTASWSESGTARAVLAARTFPSRAGHAAPMAPGDRHCASGRRRASARPW